MHCQSEDYVQIASGLKRANDSQTRINFVVKDFTGLHVAINLNKVGMFSWQRTQNSVIREYKFDTAEFKGDLYNQAHEIISTSL